MCVSYRDNMRVCHIGPIICVCLLGREFLECHGQQTDAHLRPRIQVIQRMLQSTYLACERAVDDGPSLLMWRVREPSMMDPVLDVLCERAVS